MLIRSLFRSPLRCLALAAAILLAPILAGATGASAQDRSGFYAALTGAWVVPRDSRVTLAGVGSGDVEFDSGFGVLAAAGYGFANGFRAELEIGWRNVEPEQADALDVGTLSLMANAVYAFGAWQVRPYVGAGIGAAQHALTYTLDEGDLSLSDWTFAWQLMAGLAWPLSETTEIRLWTPPWMQAFLRTARCMWSGAVVYPAC